MCNKCRYFVKQWKSLECHIQITSFHSFKPAINFFFFYRLPTLAKKQSISFFLFFFTLNLQMSTFHASIPFSSYKVTNYIRVSRHASQCIFVTEENSTEKTWVQVDERHKFKADWRWPTNSADLRGQRSLLSNDSTHSNIVKRGIAKPCLIASLTICWFHKSFQALCFRSTGWFQRVSFNFLQTKAWYLRQRYAETYLLTIGNTVSS